MPIVIKKKNAPSGVKVGGSGVDPKDQNQPGALPCVDGTHGPVKNLDPVVKPSSAIGDDVTVIQFPASQPGSSISELTEDAIAEEFARRFEGELRFDHHLGKWFRWTGNRWAPDDTHVAFDYARRLCREYRKGDTRLSTRKAAEGVEMMARRDPRLAVTADIWDPAPLLLGTPTGTVDLATGLLRSADPEDFITRLTSVGPAPEGTPHPVFSKFLDDVTAGDKDLQRFLQQWFGYCLTGLTDEHALLFIYGPGGNGKSVLQNIMFEIMHHYGKAATMRTLVESKHEAHSTDIAMLHGARLVIASETDKGVTWAEAKINRLTGGDPVTARYMRQDNFTYKPQFKLVIVGNHKPHLKSVNDAARRRIKIVPFTYKPIQPDHTLPDKLKGEAAAILRWMIDGCRDWLKNKLVEPASITQATAEYFEEQDVFGNWLEERCEIGIGCKDTASHLYTSWKEYAVTHGEDPGSAKSFAPLLVQRGFEKTKSGSTIYVGVRVKPAQS